VRLPDLTTAIRTTITIALGGIGASAGFTHTHDWASAHGQHGWLAWADAVVIEGMAVVAGFEIRRDHTTHRTTRGVSLPQLVLVAAFLIQMTAQVSQAERSPEGWLLAAMPALGFLTVVKLAMRRLPATDQPPAPTAPTTELPAPAAEPPATPEQPAVLPPTPVATVTRLPAAIRQAVTATTEQAHREGRPVTALDIRRTISLPDPMLTALVTELNASVNHHPIAEEVNTP
jgi:hypothetical protein